MRTQADYIKRATTRSSDFAEKAQRLESQWKEATATGENEQKKITCGCGQRHNLPFMFRCFYCGEFYCHSCATDHFSVNSITP